MTERICKNCKWFTKEAHWSDAQKYKGFGLCRCHSPICVIGSLPNNGETLGNLGAWPITGKDDFCGEFEEKNGKEA